jgi:hypothetical protein
MTANGGWTVALEDKRIVACWVGDQRLYEWRAQDLLAGGKASKGRQLAGVLDGLDRCPGSFFLWNRRPRNRSFQPALGVSPNECAGAMGHRIQKFRYRGFSTWYYGSHTNMGIYGLEARLTSSQDA